MGFGLTPQSAGAGWMHQIFAGCSSAIPTSQNLLPVPSGTQFATRAGALAPPGSSSSRTDKPGSKGWPRRTPHPSVLTTRVWQCSLNGMAGSRLARRKGICARIRVLRRSASWEFTAELICWPTLIVRLTRNIRSSVGVESQNQSNQRPRPRTAWRRPPMAVGWGEGRQNDLSFLG